MFTTPTALITFNVGGGGSVIPRSRSGESYHHGKDTSSVYCNAVREDVMLALVSTK